LKRLIASILFFAFLPIAAYPRMKTCSCAGNISTYGNGDGSSTNVCTGYGWSQPSNLPCDKMHMIGGTAVYVTGVWVNNGPITWVDQGAVISPGDILCAAN
jgi:hypothetical protein